MQDVDKAVQAAKKALHNPAWGELAATDRGQLIYKLADMVEQNSEMLATIEAWDNGMFPFARVCVSVAYCVPY